MRQSQSRFLETKASATVWRCSNIKRTETGSERFACLVSGLSHVLKLIVSTSQKILNNRNEVVWRQVKQQNSWLPVAIIARLSSLYFLRLKCAIKTLLCDCLRSYENVLCNLLRSAIRDRLRSYGNQDLGCASITKVSAAFLIKKNFSPG